MGLLGAGACFGRKPSGLKQSGLYRLNLRLGAYRPQSREPLQATLIATATSSSFYKEMPEAKEIRALRPATEGKA